MMKMKPMSVSDYEASMQRFAGSLGPPLIEPLLKATQEIPEMWQGWSVGRGAQYLRILSGRSQGSVAAQANVGQAQLSRLEKGDVDVLVSTLRKLYRTLGYELVIVPLPLKVTSGNAGADRV